MIRINNFIGIIVIIAITLVCFNNEVYSLESGAYITFPDGQTISTDGLADNEIIALMEISKKRAAKIKIDGETNTNNIISKKTEEFVNNPEKIKIYLDSITSAIKQVCTDLNVTINEFITTPVGIGIASLITYKILGKDVLGVISDIIDVFLVIPFWIVLMLIILNIKNKYLTTTTIYETEEIIGEGKNKKIKRGNPIRIPSYKWESKDAKVTLAGFLSITAIVFTIASLVIVFK